MGPQPVGEQGYPGSAAATSVGENTPTGETTPIAEVDPSLEPADVGRRVTAGFIDLCVITALFFVLGWLGTFDPLRFIHSVFLFWLIPVAYALIRDIHVNGMPLSIGKRLARLQVVTSKGKHPDFVNSIQRNILFFFPPLSLCMAGLELYLVLRTREHKRFGDHFGNTLVIASRA